jgi:hypothetical protein
VPIILHCGVAGRCKGIVTSPDPHRNPRLRRGTPPRGGRLPWGALALCFPVYPSLSSGGGPLSDPASRSQRGREARQLFGIPGTCGAPLAGERHRPPSLVSIWVSCWSSVGVSSERGFRLGRSASRVSHFFIPLSPFLCPCGGGVRPPAMGNGSLPNRPRPSSSQSTLLPLGAAQASPENEESRTRTKDEDEHDERGRAGCHNWGPYSSALCGVDMPRSRVVDCRGFAGGRHDYREP